jgi:acyl-CoA synthetase (AMP-forming)/AMP-acid ligase II
VYGLTEYLLVAAVEAAERLAHDEREGDLVGRSIGDARVRAAEDGELHVSGPALALGYLGGSVPVDEIATGDLGRIDGAGRIVLTGRRKEMLIRGGENIYPALYEGLLAERAGLGAAIMVGVPDAHADEAVVLFAVPRPGEDAVAARSRLVALLAGPRSPLDSHAHPDAVLGLEEVPRAGRSGKPDRAALTRIAARHLGRALPDERLVSAERTLAPPVG